MPIRTLQNFDKINAAPRNRESGTILSITKTNYTMNDYFSQPHLLDYADVADIQVGFIPILRSKTIEKCQSMSEYLLDIKNGRYKEAVEGYRAFISNKMPIETKSEAARNHKISVPCCIPHSNCTTQTISNTLPQNGFIQVDIDVPSLSNLYVEEEQIKMALDACPYIFAYHKSIGGTGYVGYSYTEDDISKAFWVVAEYMQSRGLYVDLSKGTGTGEKRFMSYDADLVMKAQFTPVEAIVGSNKDSIIKDYTWHKSSTKRLVEGAEKAFKNWVEKNGGFDWTSTGPAAPAGLFANVVSEHQHYLDQSQLMQLADWCVYLYNGEMIYEQDRSVWERYLAQYVNYDDHCTRNSATASAQSSVVDWNLVLPGFAVHNCTTTLTSTLIEIHNNILELIGVEWTMTHSSNSAIAQHIDIEVWVKQR